MTGVASDNQDVSIRAVYRIVWTDRPSLENFLSHQARDLNVHVVDPEIVRISNGLSVFRTVAQARWTAMKRPPWLGRGYMVRIVIPTIASVTLERTTKTAGHYTL